jgi:hypothetical protein
MCFAAFGLGQLRGHFEGVVGAAAVAAGVAGNQFQRVVVGSQFQRAEAALLIFERAAQQRGDLFFAERLST